MFIKEAVRAGNLEFISPLSIGPIIAKWLKAIKGSMAGAVSLH